MAIKRKFVFSDAAIDFGLREGKGQAIEQRVRESMMADAVALGQFAPREFGMRLDILAQQKKCGAHAFVLERVQDFRRGTRPGPVVEGQHQFLWPQRQRGGELFAPDLRRGLGVDREHPLGTKRLRIARA